MRRLHRGLAAAALLVLPSLAHAHAHLRSAEPPVGGTVQTAPAQVEITFSQAVDPRSSSIRVKNSTGEVVDRGDLHSPTDRDHRLVVSLRPLGPGDYQVEWHASSVDGHETEGSYSFTVAP